MRSKALKRPTTPPAKCTRSTAQCSRASAAPYATSAAPRPQAPANTSGLRHAAAQRSRAARRAHAQLRYS
eukprot:1597640-Alexandrium_andersonii.AAC.1